MSIIEMVNIVVDQCTKEYGFTPSVFKPEQTEIFYDLNYDSSKLEKTGFHWVNDIEKEIKDTLSVAFKYFNK